jgi:hypothetical protein
MVDNIIFLDEPLSYKATATNPDWVLTMEQEITSLHANNTWTLVDLPPGYSAIPVKWVYKLKSGPVGTPPKFKARLVARGDRQYEGLDYQETFAPVVKWSTIQLVVSMAAMRG